MPTLLLALIPGILNAAIIRGTVVENQSGRPLAEFHPEIAEVVKRRYRK
ncbi:MAG: hypothetical protein ABSB35_21370 [Bryobacteraceae bacterium]|jgi:hypothetical protein